MVAALTVVGDDAQSIYSFRAATVRTSSIFPAAFAPPAEIITLDQNYRSTSAILSAANAVIDLASERFTRTSGRIVRPELAPQLVHVRDEADQARFIAETVLQNREGGSTLKQQAVLFRASHHSGPLEIELTRRNIPFVKFGGLKFLDSAHIKDLLALLRFRGEPARQGRGLPRAPAHARRWPDLGTARARPTRSSSIAAGSAGGCAPPPRCGEDWPDFVAAVAELRSGKAAGPARSSGRGAGMSRIWSASTRMR